eukprot:TRINITY_DN8901_c0_g1_i1.p1 TRINITY_DN8901_c0_g1~~TRINITY_DN8901_c0_g1_i1.p1  ORF type:complete len:345 (+),score=55.81 TRINITY_DN8901_c0_g1_i1:33-1037(+)
MQFAENDVGDLLPFPVTIVNAAYIGTLAARDVARLQDVVDRMGLASARAQRLGAPVTSLRTLQTTAQRLYLSHDATGVTGLLKVGKKMLFIMTETGAIVEMEPLCCLDFYVVEAYQRKGLGKRLFDFMLEQEHVVPQELAYDRPSPKLLGFLKKHFGLARFLPQANNFVVYSKYFTERRVRTRADNALASISMRPLTSKTHTRASPRCPPKPVTPAQAASSPRHRVSPGCFATPHRQTDNVFSASSSSSSPKATAEGDVSPPWALCPPTPRDSSFSSASKRSRLATPPQHFNPSRQQDPALTVACNMQSPLPRSTMTGTGLALPSQSSPRPFFV